MHRYMSPRSITPLHFEVIHTLCPLASSLVRELEPNRQRAVHKIGNVAMAVPVVMKALNTPAILLVYDFKPGPVCLRDTPSPYLRNAPRR